MSRIPAAEPGLLGDRLFTDDNIYRPRLGYRSREPFPVSITCPHCAKIGIFTHVHGTMDAQYARQFRYTGSLGQHMDIQNAQFAIGLRFCPNAECDGGVCIVAEIKNGVPRLVSVTPPQGIAFRINDIPQKIAESLKEAIASHSVQAYRASALMIRRCLELLCLEKQSSGSNLKQRVANLGKHVILSPALLRGADELRLLGNDAAHVEAKDYDDIDEEHSEIAIEVTKKILEAVYQHDDLISRLNKLKKSNS